MNTIVGDRACKALPEGATLSAKELLHLGERAAVDQALSRLVKRGEILRVRRGLFVLPVKTRFGERVPSASTVVENIARTTGERVSISGAAAANILWLSTQNRCVRSSGCPVPVAT